MVILAAFAEHSEWGVRQLAAHTELPRSSVHRILQELADEGFLAVQDEGAYRVTPALLRFALDLAENFRVPRIAEPHLEAARDECGETTVLLMYDRGRRQVTGVAAAESLHAVRYTWQSTQPFSDLHLGASGKGVMAFLPEIERNRILAALPDPVSENPRLTKAMLTKELALIRKRGWAQSSGERVYGADGVSAPVFGTAGTVIGTVLIARPQGNRGPADAVTLGELAMRTARAISESIGCPTSALPATPSSV
jgi:DNA-binding IclR family transcriptional regulator